MDTAIEISQFNYPLPEERIAKFPLERRDLSKLLVYRGEGNISHTQFVNLPEQLPAGALLLFNNTKVVRARLIFHKPTGARIEVFCLEPHAPADYERAFAATHRSEWHVIIGNSKKWRDGSLAIAYDGGELRATRTTEDGIVRFEWSTPHTFGQLLELLGRTPIPPYLCRESCDVDTERYQTVYSRFEGSVAAPTAGLHFTDEMIAALPAQGFSTAELTLHVGAGTFLPVKEADARRHPMHNEFFEATVQSLRAIEQALERGREVIAVGTTSVRTVESLAALGERVIRTGDPCCERAVGQWEPYAENDQLPCDNPIAALREWMEQQGIERLHGSTRIMITPGYRFRVVGGIVTNFHQPHSTLLLLISALVGEDWHEIYRYALEHDFRFLSYGDSSLLLPSK